MSVVAALAQRLWTSLPMPWQLRVRAAFDWLVEIGRGEWYSQFGEDAVLQAYFETKAWRETKTTPRLRRKGFPNGFYVDVGAFAPKRHSNTYCFYRRGWRGINIDATPGTMLSFRWSRPRDTNLEVGVSEQGRDVTLYCWNYPCVINTTSEAYARRMVAETGVEPECITIPTMTLEQILDRYLPRGQPIDLMSIDVEGFEAEVLRSNNWQRYRPELLVVEQHGSSIDELLGTWVYEFVRRKGYELYAWVPPSAVFVRTDAATGRRSEARGDCS